MSQERTEQPKSAPEFIRRIMDVQGEIDRLNAVITGQAEAIREQTAKVQERDKEIERLEAKETRLIHEARGASEDALKEAEENAELREEIERLRAEAENVISVLEQFHTIDYRHLPNLADAQANRLRAALKGAE